MAIYEPSTFWVSITDVTYEKLRSSGWEPCEPLWFVTASCSTVDSSDEDYSDYDDEYDGTSENDDERDEFAED